MVESNFEKLLGKNGELVEERKRQILKGAFEIISEHYKDKPKMEAVAQLFKKKLGEEFRVKQIYGGGTVRAKFTDRGLQVLYDGNDYWKYKDTKLREMLEGVAVIEDARG